MPGSNSRPNVSEGYEVPTELPGSTGIWLDGIIIVYYYFFLLCNCLSFLLHLVAWYAVNVVNVQYNGGLPPDIILLTQGYYHRGTRLNATKRLYFSRLYSMIWPRQFCRLETIRMAHVNCKFLHLAFKIVSSAIIFIFSLERSENSQLQIPNQQRTVQHLL